MTCDSSRPHYWICGQPTAGVVDGQCKFCGVERVFAGTPMSTESIRRSARSRSNGGSNRATAAARNRQTAGGVA